MGLFSLTDAVLYAVNEEDRPLAEGIAKGAGVEYRGLLQHRFANTALQTNLMASVRGKFVVLVGSIVGDADKTLCQMLWAIRTARDSKAERILVVIPYNVYARSDKKDQPYICWGFELVADLIYEAGAWNVLLCDLHNEASGCAFKHPDVVTVRKILLDYAQEHLDIGVVVAADSGRTKVVRKVAEQRLGVLHGVVDKIRLGNTDEANATGVFGADVTGENVLVFEDELATGGTAGEAARHIWQGNPKNVYLQSSHLVLCSKTGDDLDVIENVCQYTKVISTDTCPMTPLKQKLVDMGKLVILSSASVFGVAVRNIIVGSPLGRLIEYSNG